MNIEQWKQKMSKKLIICTLKPECRGFDIGTAIDCFRKTNQAIQDVEQEGCNLYTDSFTSGSQNHESMAFLVMTILSNEELLQMLDDVCGESYNIQILT